MKNIDSIAIKLKNVLLSMSDMASALAEKDVTVTDNNIRRYAGYISQIRDFVKQSMSITENGIYEVDEKRTGINQINVNVVFEDSPTPIPLSVSDNGTYFEDPSISYNPVIVEVPEWSELDFLVDIPGPVKNTFFDVDDILIDTIKERSF